MHARLAVLAIPFLLSLSACARATAPSSPEVRFASATDDGGVVQASSEAAADDQMRVRCPGGYEIQRVEDVPVRSVAAEHTPKTDRRFTYRCIVYRPAAAVTAPSAL